jgi:hypothetical protein
MDFFQLLTKFLSFSLAQTNRLVRISPLVLGCLLWASWMIGCTLSPASKVKESWLLEEAKVLHTEVLEQRENPHEKLYRRDWLPWYYEALEYGYLYSVPYFPYLFYNESLVYLREILLLPTWFVSGGTSYQDQADQEVIARHISYEEMFKMCWPREDAQANFVNMDRWELRETAKSGL